MGPKPPRGPETILRRVLPRDEFETISGDLEEGFHDIAMRAGRRAALWWLWRQVGSVAAARLLTLSQNVLDAGRRRSMMSGFKHDLRYALRALGKQPAFTTTVVLMLALGIGANIAIFSLIHAVLLKPLPFADPDRLMLVHMLAPQRDAPGELRPNVWSYPKYQVFRDQQQVFESVALFRPATWNLTGTGTPERLPGEFVEAAYFDVLRIEASAGRTFSLDETRVPPSAPLVVLGHGFWTRRFGADPNVIGRTVGLNAIPHTIVGVLPVGFQGLSGEAEIWVPLTTLPAGDLKEPHSHSYTLIARLKPDVAVEQAQSAAQHLGDVIDRQYPDTFSTRGSRWSATAVPLHGERTDPLIRRSILILFGAVAAVLLIVCINVANLSFARAMARQREVGIRLAVGASRLRVMRQLMTESLLLSCIGAVAGGFVAYTLLSAGASLLPDLRIVASGSQATTGLTRVGLGLLGLDLTVLLYAMGIAAAAAVLFGFGPAFAATRRDLMPIMKIGASGSASQRQSAFGLRNALVAGETALALVLLTAGGLMVKSVGRLQAAELGFNPDSLLTTRLALPAPQYDSPRATQMLEQLLRRLAARPEVESVALGSNAPVTSGTNRTLAGFPGRPPVTRGTEPLIGVLWASPDYFTTLGIRLVRGRTFTEHDRAGQPKVVVINETAARTLWPVEDPIGKRISVGQGGFRDGAEVIGIVADVRYGAIETSVIADVYLPLLQSPRSGGFIFIRSRAPTEALVPVIRREVTALDPDLPLVDVKTMEDRFADVTWRTRMSAWLLGLFAGLGLLLAALGVYGVMSQAVQQRTREIGVRIALGAARGDILRLVIVRIAGIAVAGIVAGLLLAIPTMRLLTAVLYDVKSSDPAVFAPLAIVLLAVALLAGYLPARRATRVDPLTTLRAE